MIREVTQAKGGEGRPPVAGSRYTGDWVFERIDGDGKTFDFGIDYTECRIVKYLHAQEADELSPYLCHLDYVMCEAIGIGLERSKTLA